MTYVDYFSLPEVAPDYRQGHLLVWKRERNIKNSEYVSVPEDVILTTIDRHTVIVAEYEFHSDTGSDWMQGGRIQHPDHEILVLPADDSGPDWAVKGYSWQILPGSSWPFKKYTED